MDLRLFINSITSLYCSFENCFSPSISKLIQPQFKIAALKLHYQLPALTTKKQQFIDKEGELIGYMVHKKKIIILSMSQQKIKLNDIVSPKQISDPRRGPIHLLHNSFKRNTIYGRPFLPHHILPYQCKLPEVQLGRRDIAQMLKYLLKKEQLNIPDKNLVRRIIVGIFDEELLSEATLQFVNHIEVMEGRQGYAMQPESRMFYMILKGSAVIKTQGVQYLRQQGQTFGELEIMASTFIQEIYFQKNTLMITMKEEQYQVYFAPRNNRIYSDRQLELMCLQNVLNLIPTFHKYLFLSTYQERIYQMGDKIVQKGDPLQSVFIVADKLKQERLKNLLKGCIGLYELQLGKNQYEETIFCPFNQLKLPTFHHDYFRNYVLQMMDSSKLLQNSSILDKSLIRSAVSMTNPQNKVINFMRIKRVKLPTKRSKTQTNVSIETEFKFLKKEVTTPTRTHKSILQSNTPSRVKNFSLCFKSRIKTSPVTDIK